jgi:sec-independent protein translocase protein TatB
MFDISWTEFLLVGIVALIVIGPKELPGVLRTLGQYTRKVRGMAAEFQNQFQEAMREAEMADLKKQVDDMAHDIKNYDPLKDVRSDVEAMGKDIERSFDGSPVIKADAPAAELPPAETPAIESAAPESATPESSTLESATPTTPVESSTLEPALPPPPVTESAAESAVPIDKERSE